MEPQLPKPQFSPEAASSAQPTAHSGEMFVAPKTPENIPPMEQDRETREVFSDRSGGDPGVGVQFTPPPMPVIEPAQPQQAVQAVHDDTNPITASDDDLIEKEWVEKAKQVVAETRNDPHAQDAAVGKLQADYLKKRYGKVITLPKEG